MIIYLILFNSYNVYCFIMIFSRSKRKNENKKDISDFILPPQSSLSTKGALKIVDNWVQSPDKSKFNDISEINTIPGPGAYDITSFNLTNKNKGLKFSTKTVESRVKRDSSTPGPGSYDITQENTMIKKSFNTYQHVPLYKLNDSNNNSLKPTRFQGITNEDQIDNNNNNDTNIDNNSKVLRTRKEIKDTMLSLKSLAFIGEID